MPGTSNHHCSSRGDDLCWRSLQPLSQRKTGSIPQQVRATPRRVWLRCHLAPEPNSSPHGHPCVPLFWLSVTNSCQAADVSLPPRPRHPPNSSPACDEKALLSCWIADGPTSSRCDLTLMTYVMPLRPSINRKRLDHRSPFGPYSSSPVCVTPFVTYFASIESWMLVFSFTRLSA